MIVLDTWFQNKLQNRKQSSSLRELTVSTGLIDFTSNDYLGLARSKELADRIAELQRIGLHQNGATGSRLLSGNSSYALQVEEFLASIFKGESALVFNSGYVANLGVLSSIPQRGDTILYDELVHASIRDGMRLSLANRFSFKHNDVHDLEQKILKAKGKVFIVVESIYSMDGDQCPLHHMVEIAERHQAFIILDEAHSTGVIGERGHGLAVELGLDKKVSIRVYTFGKAMGIHGACVVGSSYLIQYLINFARPFIYTTALPPHGFASIYAAFNFLALNSDLQKTLEEKIKLFKESSGNMINRKNSNSSIQTSVFPGNQEVRRVALTLQEEGYDVRPILSPTVPAGSERLRICLHAYNTDQEIIQLSDWLVKLSGI